MNRAEVLANVLASVDSLAADLARVRREIVEAFEQLDRDPEATPAMTRKQSATFRAASVRCAEHRDGHQCVRTSGHDGYHVSSVLGVGGPGWQ